MIANRTFKQRLKCLVERDDTPAGRRFEFFIMGLILCSLVAFSIETLPNLSGLGLELLNYFEVIVIAVFTLEYLARIYVADHRLKFIFSFFGMIDLLAIIPFYLTLGMDLRSVRTLRLFRLVLLVKLVRYSESLERFRRAFVIAKEDLALFFAGAIMLLYLSAIGIYLFENSAQPEVFSSVFHSLWWALSTLTTVGYGDVYPITVGGKIFTFFVLMLGLGIVAVPTGLISSALVKARQEDRERQAETD